MDGQVDRQEVRMWIIAIVIGRVLIIGEWMGISDQVIKS